MIKLVIQIDADDNDAFFGEQTKRNEVSRITHEIARKLRAHLDEGSIQDVNGNSVGHWHLEVQ